MFLPGLRRNSTILVFKYVYHNQNLAIFELGLPGSVIYNSRVNDIIAFFTAIAKRHHFSSALVKFVWIPTKSNCCRFQKLKIPDQSCYYFQSFDVFVMFLRMFFRIFDILHVSSQICFYLPSYQFPLCFQRRQSCCFWASTQQESPLSCIDL